MSEYKLNFNVANENCTNFKQKNLEILRNTIEGSHIGQNLKFKCYANITFDKDDRYHYKPIVNELPDFNRLKTNCFIYDVVGVPEFTHVFVYQNVLPKGGFYGFIQWNENRPDKYWHQYYIDREDDNFVRMLKRNFVLLNFKEKYEIDI